MEKNPLYPEGVRSSRKKKSLSFLCVVKRGIGTALLSGKKGDLKQKKGLD